MKNFKKKIKNKYQSKIEDLMKALDEKQNEIFILEEKNHDFENLKNDLFQISKIKNNNEISFKSELKSVRKIFKKISGLLKQEKDLKNIERGLKEQLKRSNEELELKKNELKKNFLQFENENLMKIYEEKILEVKEKCKELLEKNLELFQKKEFTLVKKNEKMIKKISQLEKEILSHKSQTEFLKNKNEEFQKKIQILNKKNNISSLEKSTQTQEIILKKEKENKSQFKSFENGSFGNVREENKEEIFLELTGLKDRNSLTKNKWIEHSTILSTFLVGLHMKWLNMINIKCCFWELSEGLIANYELNEESPSYKFFEIRKCFWSIVAILRLKKLVSVKKDDFENVRNSLSLSLKNGDLRKGKDMFNRMMILSSYSNTYALELITYLKEENSSEEALIRYFGFKRAKLYPVLRFEVLKNKKFGGEEEDLEIVREKIANVEDKIGNAMVVMEQVHGVLKEKDRRIKALEYEIKKDFGEE